MFLEKSGKHFKVCLIYCCQHGVCLIMSNILLFLNHHSSISTHTVVIVSESSQETAMWLVCCATNENTEHVNTLCIRQETVIIHKSRFLIMPCQCMSLFPLNCRFIYLYVSSCGFPLREAKSLLSTFLEKKEKEIQTKSSWGDEDNFTKMTNWNGKKVQTNFSFINQHNAM